MAGFFPIESDFGITLCKNVCKKTTICRFSMLRYRLPSKQNCWVDVFLPKTRKFLDPNRNSLNPMEISKPF